MFLLNSSFLWALLGLSVPLAIHLWSNKQGKNLKVGSIRFLKESDSLKSRSVKLNEAWLLLLRMLLVSLLVFILSEPRWPHKTDRLPLVYLIESSLLRSPEIKALADSLDAQADVHVLAPHFPEYDPDRTETEITNPPKYWQLAREMQSLNADSLVVFTNAFLKGIEGKRPEISSAINWIQIDPEQEQNQLVGVIKGADEEKGIFVNSEAEAFTYETKTLDRNANISDSVVVIKKDTLRISIVDENQYKTESKYLEASFSAVSKYLEHPIEIKVSNDLDSLSLTSTDFLVWLREEDAPPTDVKILKFRKNDLSGSLIEPGSSENDYFLTAGLTSENIVEDHLSEHLLKLMNLYPEIEKQAELYDLRLMNLELFKPKFENSSTLNSKKEGKDFSNYLWISFMILLLSERMLSKYRKQ